MANQPMSDNKLVRLGIKKIKKDILINKADGESPINLVKILVCEKPKGKNKPKWQKWLPEEFVYKARHKDPNLDTFLMEKLARRHNLKNFLIKEIKEIKFIGYGKLEE
jgi:hypothetical protein